MLAEVFVAAPTTLPLITRPVLAPAPVSTPHTVTPLHLASSPLHAPPGSLHYALPWAARCCRNTHVSATVHCEWHLGTRTGPRANQGSLGICRGLPTQAACAVCRSTHAVQTLTLSTQSHYLPELTQQVSPSPGLSPLSVPLPWHWPRDAQLTSRAGRTKVHLTAGLQQSAKEGNQPGRWVWLILPFQAAP